MTSGLQGLRYHKQGTEKNIREYLVMKTYKGEWSKQRELTEVKIIY